MLFQLRQALGRCNEEGATATRPRAEQTVHLVMAQQKMIGSQHCPRRWLHFLTKTACATAA